MNKKQLEKFVTTCTLTFKAFDHDVHISRNKANLWHFTSTSPRSEKKYMVYCTEDITKVRSLIKIATNKVPKGCRLVVVTMQITDEDLNEAEIHGYTVVSHQELKQYGAQMLEAKAQSAA